MVKTRTSQRNIQSHAQSETDAEIDSRLPSHRHCCPFPSPDTSGFFSHAAANEGKGHRIRAERVTGDSLPGSLAAQADSFWELALSLLSLAAFEAFVTSVSKSTTLMKSVTGQELSEQMVCAQKGRLLPFRRRCCLSSWPAGSHITDR